jgi:hypothetical protein
MALQASQVVTTAGITPATIAATTSDTIAEGSFGPAGVNMRVVTTSTATNVSVQDPNYTASSNLGTVTPVAIGTASVRKIFIPRSAVNPTTGVATVTFSAATGVSYELDRV